MEEKKFTKEEIQKLIIYGIVIGITIVIGFLLYNFYKDSKERGKNKLSHSTGTFEIAEPFLSIDVFNHNKKENTEDFTGEEATKELEFKKYGNYILKKEDDKVYQYSPVELPICIDKIYKLEDGFIYACTAEETRNYYTDNEREKFYRLDIDNKYLENLESFGFATIDLSDTNPENVKIINDKTYVLQRNYSNILLYKKFEDTKYQLIDQFDLKEIVSKEKDIRSWYEEQNSITLITKTFGRYKVEYELTDDLSLKAIYLPE